MEQIQAFRTSDGEVYTKRLDAVFHEIGLKIGWIKVRNPLAFSERKYTEAEVHDLISKAVDAAYGAGQRDAKPSPIDMLRIVQETEKTTLPPYERRRHDCPGRMEPWCQVGQPNPWETHKPRA